jgi:hypothetical protein
MQRLKSVKTEMNKSRNGMVRTCLLLLLATVATLFPIASRAEDFPVSKVTLSGSAGARYSCAVTTYGLHDTTTVFRKGDVPATLSFTNQVRYSLEFRRVSKNGNLEVVVDGGTGNKFSCSLAETNQLADLHFVNPKTVLTDGKDVSWKQQP